MELFFLVKDDNFNATKGNKLFELPLLIAICKFYWTVPSRLCYFAGPPLPHIFESLLFLFFIFTDMSYFICPQVEQKQKYAAWKAADIRKALKEGRKPVPGPPGGENDAPGGGYV